METPRKYAALRWIGVLANVVAWVVAVIGLIALIWVLSNVSLPWARTLLVVIVLFWGISTFLSFFVRGTVLLLLSDLERQARVNAQMVDQMRSLIQNTKTTAAPAAPMTMTRAESRKPDSESSAASA
jgi:hypothetical protein